MMSERFLPLLAAAVIAIAVTVLSTGGVPSPFAPGPGGTTEDDDGTAGGASVPTPTTSDETEEAALRAHALLPASLRPGGSRQLLLQLSGPALLDMDADHLLEITFTLEEPHAGVWIRPEQQLLRRGSIPRTRFAIGLHGDVPCDAELGDLHVAVRDLAADGAAGDMSMAMPSVNCEDAPPSSPESVHITDPVCGEDWREDLQAIKEGDEPDPQRCAEERWGEASGSGLRPPPARPAPRASAPGEDTPEETEEVADEADEAPEEAAAEAPGEAPDEASEGAPDEASEGAPDEASEGAPDEASEGAPQEAPEETEEATGSPTPPPEEEQEQGSEEPSNEAPEVGSEERGEPREPPDDEPTGG